MVKNVREKVGRLTQLENAPAFHTRKSPELSNS
jgi:hypothetical protein